MPRTEQRSERKNRQEGKSLTHRLDLSGVEVPSPKANGRAQKRRGRSHKGTETGTPSPTSCKKESKKMPDNNNAAPAPQTQTQDATQQQAASVAEQALTGKLGNIKGVDVRVRVHKEGIDWAGHANTGIKVATGVVGVGGAVAIGLGVARLFGFKPAKPAVDLDVLPD